MKFDQLHESTMSDSIRIRIWMSGVGKGLTVNHFTATLFFRAWHRLENLVLLTSITVKYSKIIYKYTIHALRNPTAYHN